MNYKSVFLLATTALALPLAAILIGRALAARRLRRDVAQLFAQAANVSNQLYRETQLVGLPAPVQRYFRQVLRDGQPYLRGLRLRHGGQFKTALEKDWVDITGEQYVTADPPGFIWQGTTRQFTARDEFVAGRGRLTVRLLGALPIAGGAGPTYDQGELLRWLVESTWLPTALLPGEHTAWTPIDDHSARLTFTYGGQSVSCLARFNERNGMAACETLRYFNETTELPWVARFSQYRRWLSVLVPTRGEANWVVNGQLQPYARFIVQELAYDQLYCFNARL